MPHDAAEHHIYMAAHNRKYAHAYRRFHEAMGFPIPGQFYYHMREAIRWIQVGKFKREEYRKMQETAQ